MGGKPYSGTRVRIWDATFNRSKLAEAYVGNRRKGDSVTVFYDPAHPESSVLDFAYPIASVAPLVLAAVVSGVIAVLAKPILRTLNTWLLARSS